MTYNLQDVGKILSFSSPRFDAWWMGRQVLTEVQRANGLAIDWADSFLVDEQIKHLCREVLRHIRYGHDLWFW